MKSRPGRYCFCEVIFKQETLHVLLIRRKVSFLLMLLLPASLSLECFLRFQSLFELKIHLTENSAEAEAEHSLEADVEQLADAPRIILLGPHILVVVHPILGAFEEDRWAVGNGNCGIEILRYSVPLRR